MTLATSWNIAWALNILIWECAECSKLAPTVPQPITNIVIKIIIMLSGTLGMCIVQSLLPQFITRRQCRILMISCRFLHLTNHRKNLILIERVWINSINKGVARGLWGGFENNCSPNSRSCRRSHHTGRSRQIILFTSLSLYLLVWSQLLLFICLRFFKKKVSQIVHQPSGGYHLWATRHSSI